tara:strand:- start:1938 stop:2618 length:681 start_codon:yes stop_codon:yes gene_type:complete
MKDYILDSVNEANDKIRQSYIHNKPILVLQPFTNKLNFASVIEQVEYMVPRMLMNNIDAFYVGNFEELTKDGRHFNAMYTDGAIYISPDQDNERDLLDDIIHEIAHSLEGQYGDFIYGDGSIEREFIAKRRRLYYLIDKPTLDMVYYTNTDYDYKFDDHMYKDVGYDKLRITSAELFYSPYAITSLREYWANGFENYLLGDRRILKDISPALYIKVTELLDLNEEY